MIHKTLGVCNIDLIEDGLADVLFEDGTFRQFRTEDINSGLFEADPLEWISLSMALAAQPVKEESEFHLPKPRYQRSMWLADDFDYRCNDDSCPELMGNFSELAKLGTLTKDLVESADFFVVLGDFIDPAVKDSFKATDPETGEVFFTKPLEEVEAVAKRTMYPVKVIRRRNPEFLVHEIEDAEPETEIVEERDATPEDLMNLATEEYDETDPEVEDLGDHDIDALDNAVEGLTPDGERHLSAPKQRFDLLCDERAKAGQTLPRCLIKYPDASKKSRATQAHAQVVTKPKSSEPIIVSQEELQGFSAPIFPQKQDKRIRTRARFIERDVRNGKIKNGYVLGQLIKQALKSHHVTQAQAKRLWEVMRMRDYQKRQQQ